MPLSGTVVAANQALADDPELVNASPMQDGWFFRIQVANLADLDTLMDQDGYDRFLADNA
ncbi:Glycine cleavage system H protein [compost metagenome]